MGFFLDSFFLKNLRKLDSLINRFYLYSNILIIYFYKKSTLYNLSHSSGAGSIFTPSSFASCS